MSSISFDWFPESVKWLCKLLLSHSPVTQMKTQIQMELLTAPHSRGTELRFKLRQSCPIQRYSRVCGGGGYPKQLCLGLFMFELI